MQADSFTSRIVAAAARPARPWLQVTASPRVARFLITAGARPAPVQHGDKPARRIAGYEQRPIPTPGVEDLADEMPSEKAELIILLIQFRLRRNWRPKNRRRRVKLGRRSLP